MLETALFFLHSAVVLAFGVFLSAAFSGVKFTKKNIKGFLLFCVFCGGLQLFLHLRFSQKTVWNYYPLITHLPVVLLLFIAFRRKFLTALVAVLSAYLFCQPAKWMGVFTFQLTQSASLEYVARLLSLLGVGAFAIKFAAPSFSGIFNKDLRSVAVFGIIPLVYYIFDYIAVVYTDFLLAHNEIAIEFLPLLLCITFLLFCIIYYKEYEQKADAERKEQIVQIVAAQQSKQIETTKKIEHSLRVERHDMRHFLNRLALCINTDDLPKAKVLLQEYLTQIDGTQYTRFCGCDTVNYVISAFANQCEKENISFQYHIELESLHTDELLFCSILQNALENALNAQLLLEPQERSVQLLLKYLDGKLLFSLKNTTKEIPKFSDGLPLTTQPGHGYGTQSIRYLTERLGGGCQFSCNGDLFILRIMI